VDITIKQGLLQTALAQAGADVRGSAGRSCQVSPKAGPNASPGQLFERCADTIQCLRRRPRQGSGADNLRIGIGSMHTNVKKAG